MERKSEGEAESEEVETLYGCSRDDWSLKPSIGLLPSFSPTRIPPGKKGVEAGFSAGLLARGSMAMDGIFETRNDQMAEHCMCDSWVRLAPSMLPCAGRQNE